MLNTTGRLQRPVFFAHEDLMKIVCTLLLLLAALATRAAAAGTMLSTFSADLPVDFKPAALAQPDANGV